jgi:curved DNA-binding protein
VKFKDYYAILEVDRTAASAQIKRAYRRLARKYHPDVSQERDAEERFKDVAEAWRTLKDPGKRAAYDRLGTAQSGQEFTPAPDWQEEFAGGPGNIQDLDLGALLASLRGHYGDHPGTGGRGGKDASRRGQDVEVEVTLTLEQAFHGCELELALKLPGYDARGQLRYHMQTIKTRIPQGAGDGERLRVPGRGGGGRAGGRAGDLVMLIALLPHDLFRAAGHDLFVDLPVTPWEAVLGTHLELPTPGGPVLLRIAAGAQGGQQLRLRARGLPRPHGEPGDLFAVLQIAVPAAVDDATRALFEELARVSDFAPRAHLAGLQEMSA